MRNQISREKKQIKNYKNTTQCGLEILLIESRITNYTVIETVTHTCNSFSCSFVLIKPRNCFLTCYLDLPPAFYAPTIVPNIRVVCI